MERRLAASKIQLQEPGVTEVFLATWLLLLTPLPPLLLQHHRPLGLRVLEAEPRPLHPPPTTRDLRRIIIQDQREYFIDKRQTVLFLERQSSCVCVPLQVDDGF
jgi:hypothetical protein